MTADIYVAALMRLQAVIAELQDVMDRAGISNLTTEFACSTIAGLEEASRICRDALFTASGAPTIVCRRSDPARSPAISAGLPAVLPG